MSNNNPPLPFYEDPEIRERFDAGARRTQQQFWDAQAATWDATQNRQGLQPRHIECMRPWLSDPVLLVGTGRGMILQALRAAGYDATGVDWSANMVAEAQRDGISGLRCADAGDLPDADQSFATVIISTGVMLPTHTEARREAYLGEARRVLTAGGRLILCVLFDEGSAKARRTAESVRLPIHTIHAQVHWELGPLAASVSRLGLRTLDRVAHDDVVIWTLEKTNVQF